METSVIKIWQVTDVEWFAAITAEDALRAYQEYATGCYGADTLARKETDELREEFGEPVMVGEQWMDRLKYTDEDEGTRRTFREELNKRIADGDEFPQFFATSEY